MKRTIMGTLLGTTLALGGMLTTAHADIWVFKDTLRPHGHDRGMAAKRADGRKCGASDGGRSFTDGPGMRQCMLTHGWVLDRIMPDRPSARARSPNYDTSPPIDNSSNDDWVQRQRDQDNLQQMLNTQQMINDQQRLNDQMFQQQQQQMMNQMNNQ